MEGFERGVSMVYVKIMQDMNNKARTSLKCVCEEKEDFAVKVSAHHEFALNPYAFSLVMDELMKHVQDEASWCIIFVDYIVFSRLEYKYVRN